MKKNSSLNFLFSVDFQASKIWTFFWKIYCRTSFEILFRQKSLKPPVFGFCDSLLFGLEEPGELRALIRWVLG